MNQKPMVSVVIPTYARPALVERAVKSALEQTLSNIEVIVVTDGPDEITEVALSGINDSRIKVLTLPTHQGANEARNKGIFESQGVWIALLDDDDEWLPTKLEDQLVVAEQSKFVYPIVTCFVVERSPTKAKVASLRIPKPGEPLGEFLFTRKKLFQSYGVMQTSSLLAKKDLFRNVLFQEGLSRHQEWDWLLRVVHQSGVGIEFVAKPLTVWEKGENRQHIGIPDWQRSLSWIRENRSLLTPRAYAGFLLRAASYCTAGLKGMEPFFLLVREAFSFGKPHLFDLVSCFYVWGKLRSSRLVLMMFQKASTTESTNS